MPNQPKRKIDDLFPEYDIKLRNWILEKLKEDLARSGVPKNNPYYYLVSPSKQTEDDPMLRDKYLAESLSNIRRFVKELWPRKGKRGRMVRVGAEWYKTKDE